MKEAISILVLSFWVITLCEPGQVNQNQKSKIAQFDDVDFDDIDFDEDDSEEEEYILTELQQTPIKPKFSLESQAIRLGVIQ